VIAYQNIPIRELPAPVMEMMANHTIDWVVFTSSSTVDNFIAALPAGLPWSEHCRIASIGPTTSTTLRKYDIHPTVEAQQHTLRGLLHAMST